MYLYLDIIWLLNWIFDTLLLYWTSVLLKSRVSLWRLALGGFAGSLIVLLAFTPYSKFAEHVLVKISFSILMVLIVFGYTRLKHFFKAAATLYFITFLSGGILLGMHYLFEENILMANQAMGSSINQYGDPVSWIFIAVGFPLAWLFSKHTLDGMEITKLNHQQMVEVITKIEGFEGRFQGLIDSGNQLYDPLSGAPVMIISLKGLESDMPADMLPVFVDPEQWMKEEENGYNCSWAGRIRIIPYKVIGHEHQLLTAVKPDFVQIIQGEKEYRLTKVLVSFSNLQLSSDKSYQCIIHPKMLTGIPGSNAS
ncbi:sigma-E processing peptidase SpoIIGA [Bacillus massiliglaciei]|uniref:sigma-E processing peptidase SpoIIGA n=1 Tax=Bacillus massiliglaciei TaxID=1816693 RepID=UPI000A98CDA0|nr:sigma-E processing peptidase SpoIIGA [Bacillus massiliglaciei]